MWQPDGWGWRARIGVLTPHGDIGPEAEFRAMAPEGVSIHAARVPLGAIAPGAAHGMMDRVIAHDAVRAFAEPPLVDDADRTAGCGPAARDRVRLHQQQLLCAARPTTLR